LLSKKSRGLFIAFDEADSIAGQDINVSAGVVMWWRILINSHRKLISSLLS
jgi:hypothetical protein